MLNFSDGERRQSLVTPCFPRTSQPHSDYGASLTFR